MREANINRTTTETDINMTLELDGKGEYDINTGIGFFDHMLELFTRHSQCDLTLCAKGDLQVDYHHTVEDCGIVLGQAIKAALADKKGICRYGNSFVPMDEALAQVTIDLSGRSYLVFNAEFTRDKVGEFDMELVEEFLMALASNAGMTLHVNLHYGTNSHHEAEAIFKALARSLREAIRIDATLQGVLSTKGVL